MEAWKQLINTALLGTGKAAEGTVALSALQGMADVQGKLEAQGNDAETRLLETTAVLYAYRRCGVMPLSETIKTAVADPETKPYCSKEAMQALHGILQSGSIGLLRLWLERCDAAGSIAPPIFSDQLLQLGIQHKALRPLIISCCGKRGEWLCRLNPDWAFHTEGSDAGRWETGTTAERTGILRAVRTTAPAEARAMLEGVWTQEKADVKEALLQAMETNLSEDDRPFLEGIIGDKSKRVQTLAYNFLTRIPGSSIIRAFEKILRQLVRLQTTKKLMGLMSKTSLEIAYPKELDKTLLDAIGKKPAGLGGISDAEYQLLTMMSSVPPHFWEAHLGVPPQRVLELFDDVVKDRLYKDALRDATIRFKDRNWATLFRNEFKLLQPGLLPLLSATAQLEYLMNCAKAAQESVIDYYAAQETEWDAPLAPALMAFVATNPYHYNKGFFNANTHLIPLSIMPILESFAPSADATTQDYARQYAAQTWHKTSEYLHSLLELKQRTITAFQN